MIEFTVSDITCGHCARAVTNALKAADENAAVDMDVHKRRIGQ